MNNSKDQYGIYSWYVLFFLTVLYVISFIDRQILSLLIGPIQQELAISDFQISLVQGLAFALFYTVLGIPIAYLSDRMDRRLIIAIGVLIWSVMTAACGFASSFLLLFLARVGVGIGEGALSPAAHSMISDYFPKRLLGMAMSIYGFGVVIGIGLAFIAGSLIIKFTANSPGISIFGWPEVSPWRLAFFITSVPGVIFLLLMITIKEPNRLDSGTVTFNTPKNPSGFAYFQIWYFLTENKNILLPYIIGFSCIILAGASYFSWIPTYFIRIHGWSIESTGLIYGIVILIFGSLALLSGGFLSDFLFSKGHKDAPLIIGVISGLGIILTSLILLLGLSDLISMAVIALGVFFVFLPAGVMPAGLHIITPNRLRAQISAVFLFSANLIGLTLGASGVALLTDYIFQNPLSIGKSIFIVTGFSGVISVLLLSFRRTNYQKMVDKQQ